MFTNELKQIFEALHDGVLAAKDGVVVYANPAAGMILHKDLTDARVEDHIPADVVSASFDNKVKTVLDGVPCTVKGEKLEDITVFVLSPVHDVTFAYRVLPALREALAPYLYASDSLLELLEDDEQEAAFEHTSIMDRCYFKLLRIVEDLADIAAIHEPVEEPYRTFDLGSLYGDVVDAVIMLVNNRNIEISFECDEREMTYFGDPRLAERLFLKLLANAIAGIAPKGKGKIKVRLKYFGKDAIIIVRDNGTGIDTRTMLKGGADAVTLPTPQQGAGLGLSVVRTNAERLGGRLLMESKAGEGTTATLMLPLAPKGHPSADFGAPEDVYLELGLSVMLTELSSVLPSDAYTPKFRD